MAFQFSPASAGSNFQFLKKAFLGFTLFTIYYLLFTTPAWAQTTNIAQSIQDLNFFQADLGVFITRTVEVALIIGSILVLAYLMWGGIEWITSGGDKTKYEDARNKITAALFGIAIMASGWALWTLANYFFGIDKVIQTGGGGGRTGTDECWPFTSCAAWETEFSRLHGRSPNAQDRIDFGASQDFLRQTGRSPSQADWECRLRNNYQWCQ